MLCLCSLLIITNRYLPRDASEMFGEMFFNHVIPSFFNNDKEKILHNSRITYNGNLTPRFRFLIDYISD